MEETKKPKFLERSIQCVESGYNNVIGSLGFFETRGITEKDELIEFKGFSANRTKAMEEINKLLLSGKYKSFVFANSCLIAPRDNKDIKMAGITFYYLNEHGEEHTSVVICKDGKSPVEETDAPWVKDTFPKGLLWKITASLKEIADSDVDTEK